MDKTELIMTIAKELLIEGIRKDQVPVNLRGANQTKIAAAAYSDAMAALVSGLKGTYDSIKEPRG